MNESPEVGSTVWIRKPELDALLARLREWGYEVYGPRLADGAVTLAPVSSLNDFPVGVRDHQEPGKYRLEPSAEAGYFDHVVGPHSLKPFVFPSRTTVLEVLHLKGEWQAIAPEPPRLKQAIIGVRSCDLHALAIQDRVFLGGTHKDPEYAARRDGLFLAAVNCSRSASTCFCVSMHTGPKVETGADLVLTELSAGFVIRVDTDLGASAMTGLDWRLSTTEELSDAEAVPRRAAAQQSRRINLDTVADTLLKQLNHPHWNEVAKRCLACANCTMVCPTCFCSTVREVTDLTGTHTIRERTWESCFNEEHSWTGGGAVHPSTTSRYRQWLTHKLATWQGQFGTSGCVGCGRCITWCPVGIDITEEVAVFERSVK